MAFPAFTAQVAERLRHDMAEGRWHLCESQSPVPDAAVILIHILYLTTAWVCTGSGLQIL